MGWLVGWLCTTVIHNTAKNTSNNLPSYPPNIHHCSDAVYWRGGEISSCSKCIQQQRTSWITIAVPSKVTVAIYHLL